ncbi:MAG: site-2 protease family protein [Nanoarchaeota archaeon]|nr:site-2 protease family protein [Nanoarchaeota archaeon]
MDYAALDLQTIAAIIFILIMSLFLFLKRKELALEKIIFPIFYIIMYRTKIGIAFMDRMAKKYKNVIQIIAYIGIIVGFIGMGVIVFFLVKNLIQLFLIPTAKPAIGLVLPFKVKGTFFVPFFYWLICIFIIALVHEFSHGVVARTYGIKVKSSGLAFMAILLPIIPAAFVEPDEKKLAKRPKKEQLAVFAAGPFSNILLAGLVVLISWAVFTPVMNNMIENNGIIVAGLITGETKYPAELAGIKPGEAIISVDGQEIKTGENFIKILNNKKPGENIIIITNVTTYNLVLASNPSDAAKPYLGVYIAENTKIKPSFEQRYSKYAAPIITWLYGLLYWLFALSLGIGLFNLAPLGPVDGGRMLQSTLEKIFKENKKKAYTYWKWISLVFLALVLANLAFAFIR